MKLNKTIFFAIGLTVILDSSCVDRSIRQTSSNIEEAKDKNVFVQEYKPFSSVIVMDDTIAITIASAWVETNWFYNDVMGSTIRKSSKVSFRVKLKDPIPSSYSVKWNIGTDKQYALRIAGQYDMIADLKKYKLNDTICFYVRDRDYKSPDIYDTISKVVFIPTGK